MSENDNAFIKNERKKKITLSELYILKKLSDKNLIISSAVLSNRNVFFYNISTKETAQLSKRENETLPSFINLNNGLSNLSPKRYVEGIDKDSLSEKIKSKYGIEKNFSWYEHVFRISSDGKEFVKNNPDLFEALENKIQEEKNSNLFIASKKGEVNYRGYSNALQAVFGVGSALKVLRETKSRYYVEYADEDIFGPKSRFNDFVEGSEGKFYIEKSNVHTVDINPDTFKKLKNVTNEYEQYQVKMKDEEEEALKPIRDRFKARREQAIAMFEDNIREVLNPEPENSKYKL